MDGYSVKDAAVVLGIPERRVWELLARGVLAGAPEGPDGMIVYLQPRGGPVSMAPSQAAAGAASEASGARTNGNGGSHELSPFRELLTEFRNLTERYGQALLALGEARGEVAALRGRVDLLEARMDLRLPSTPATSTVAWEMSDFAAEEAPARSASGADAAVVEEAASPESGAAVAGEDEPAAEPMIDLVEEAIVEELPAEEELIPEPAVEQIDGSEALVAIETAAVEPAIVEVPMDEATPEAETPEAVAAEVGAAEPEPEIVPAVEPEPMAAATPAEPEEAAEEPPEAPRRRARGGRTATAAFAAALARADDPTIAELPGAEETAAALAALQRDIDASHAVTQPDIEPVPAESSDAADEPDAIAETESVAEPAVIEETAAVAAIEETPAPAELPAEAEVPEPPVPSYYSTDVVDPDWFADGDFSWLEAAQAEAVRIEAERSQAPDASPESAAGVLEASADEEPPAAEGEPHEAVPDEPVAQAEAPEPIPERMRTPITPSDAPRGTLDDASGDLRAVPMEMRDEATGVVADVAFGEHPDTDATAPDVAHDRFEPSVESQAMAEEEARSAIQDAFEEAPGGREEESPFAEGTAVAVATAVAEPETELEAEPDVAEDHASNLADEAPAMADEPEAGAIQQAFEPPEQSAGERVRAEYQPDHEAEVETEAIQEAFEEPMPAPEWSAAEPEAAFADEPPRTIDDAPPASHGTPRTTAAAVATFHGPEEFIAPSAPATPPAPAPMNADPAPSTGTQSAPTPGEEPLMWLGEEFEEADLEVAAQGWRSPGAAPAAQAEPTPVLELSDAELAQLAEDEGWDADEVEAIKRLLGRPSDAPPPEMIPPAAPVRDAVPQGSPPSSAQSDQPSGGSPAPPATAASQPSFADTSETPQSWSPPPPDSAAGTETDETIDPNWLQGRSSAAADAYRRLRKLFPN
jgi:hypothetical protein